MLMVSTTSSGGLFDDESKDAEMAFKFAVQAINNQRNKQTDGLLDAGEICLCGVISLRERDVGGMSFMIHPTCCWNCNTESVINSLS